MTLGIDYFRLMGAVASHYRYSTMFGWPPMFKVYSREDEDKEDLLATVKSREGLFKIRVSQIYVYTKEIDEFFQRVIGLDYYKIRVDHIKKHRKRKEDDDLTDEFDDDADDDYRANDDEEYEGIDEGDVGIDEQEE